MEELKTFLRFMINTTDNDAQKCSSEAMCIFKTGKSAAYSDVLLKINEIEKKPRKTKPIFPG